jgi:hypothetical protein
MAKKVKVTNPNQFAVGLRLMDGLKEIPVFAKSFTMLPEDEIYFINNMCTLFKKKFLLIEDDEINEILGFKEKTVVNLSDEEIADLLKGNLPKMKKELEQIKEKHIIDRVVKVVKTIEDLHVNKIKFLEEWSGYDFNTLTSKEESK